MVFASLGGTKLGQGAFSVEGVNEKIVGELPGTMMGLFTVGGVVTIGIEVGATGTTVLGVGDGGGEEGYGKPKAGAVEGLPELVWERNSLDAGEGVEERVGRSIKLFLRKVAQNRKEA